MKTVNSKKILVSKLGASGTTIDIPLSTNFFPVDNSELITHQFVEQEKEKVINQNSRQ